MLQQFADKYEYFKGSSARPQESAGGGRRCLGHYSRVQRAGHEARPCRSAQHLSRSDSWVGPPRIRSNRDPGRPNTRGCWRWSRRSWAAQIAPGNGRATRLFFLPARGLQCKVRRQVFTRTHRATNGCARRRRTKSRVVGTLIAEAMNTFAKSYAGPSAASSVHRQCS
jgi:hypothetical protein